MAQTPPPTQPSEKPKAPQTQKQPPAQPSQQNPRIDANGKPYSVKNPPKLPTPKPGESLNLPPVPKMRPDPPKGPQTVHDSKLIASLQYMKTNNFMQEPKTTIKFDSVKEAEDTAKEDVVSAINERMHSIQQDMSELQKKGHDMSIQKMKLLQVPLKTNLWRATRSAKELQKIFTIFIQIENVVNPLKQLQEKKNLEHEQYLKNKEAQLENEKKTREIAHKQLITPIKKTTTQQSNNQPSQAKPITNQSKQPPANQATRNQPPKNSTNTQQPNTTNPPKK